MDAPPRSPIPARYAEAYLDHGPRLVLLLVANGIAFLVGVDFYVHSSPSLREIPTLLYPLFGDSPTALALATLSLATLLPAVGLESVRDAPLNRPLAYLHTFAFVWLLKYGVWTVVALSIRPDLYVGFTPALLWDYWGIVLTHLGFVVEAAVIPHYGATTRGALLAALGALLLNDVYDYGFGFYPPLKYEPGVVLPAVTVLLSVVAVGVAAWSFPRLDSAV